MLSLIVPCYNEEENVLPFFEMVLKAFQKSVLEYEIIYINDGSRDNTELNLKKLWENHSNIVSVVNFSRNFGKESAILAGLKHAKGDYVTIIDADLQQRPEIVLEMVDFLNNHAEYDAVAAYQIKRIEGKVISFYKKIFYKLVNKVCDIEIHSGASDFRTFRRKVVNAILSVPEYFRFSKGIFSWVGFETYYMPYIADERNSGETKWSIWRLFKYALEGFISFSTFPLKIATYLGGGFFGSRDYLYDSCYHTEIFLFNQYTWIYYNCCFDISFRRIAINDIRNHRGIFSKNIHTRKKSSYLY